MFELKCTACRCFEVPVTTLPGTTRGGTEESEQILLEC